MKTLKLLIPYEYDLMEYKNAISVAKLMFLKIGRRLHGLQSCHEKN